MRILEDAVIVPAQKQDALIRAARTVVEHWSSNRLAEAVRNLAAIIPEE